MKSTFLTRLTDRLILVPTRHVIDTSGKTRQLIPFGDGKIEVWMHRIGAESEEDVDLFVLKFPGAGSRAEYSTDHPAEWWPGARAETWAVNFPGYGGSSGRASLQSMAPAADTVFAALERHAAGRPIVAVGNSLGCVSSLYMAARGNVQALVLRNPPALREVILERFGWRGINLGARLIASQIPDALCSIRNAAAAAAPAVIVTSGRDRIVPYQCQQMVVDAYAGPHRTLLLTEADHHTPMNDEQSSRYGEQLDWLFRSLSNG
jgi:pimeloyl-ACP methyl ester carboxylesterase